MLGICLSRGPSAGLTEGVRCMVHLPRFYTTCQTSFSVINKHILSNVHIVRNSFPSLSSKFPWSCRKLMALSWVFEKYFHPSTTILLPFFFENSISPQIVRAADLRLWRQKNSFFMPSLFQIEWIFCRWNLCKVRGLLNDIPSFLLNGEFHRFYSERSGYLRVGCLGLVDRVYILCWVALFVRSRYVEVVLLKHFLILQIPPA